MSVDESGCRADELAWFKSSYSAGDGGECVEVADCPNTVHVRDSKDIARPGLTVAPTVWASFVGFASEV